MSIIKSKWRNIGCARNEIRCQVLKVALFFRRSNLSATPGRNTSYQTQHFTISFAGWKVKSKSVSRSQKPQLNHACQLKFTISVAERKCFFISDRSSLGGCAASSRHTFLPSFFRLRLLLCTPKGTLYPYKTPCTSNTHCTSYTPCTCNMPCTSNTPCTRNMPCTCKLLITSLRTH